MSLSPQRVDFESIWARLAERVTKVITLTSVKGMEMFEDIYKLCTAQPQPHSEILYYSLKSHLEAHVGALRTELLQAQSGLLADYLKHWSNYSAGVEYLSAIFRYLNMNWIKKKLEDTRNKIGSLNTHNSDVYEVLTLGLVVWRDQLFTPLKERLTRAAHDLLTRERDGDQVPSAHITALMNSLIKLGSINKGKQLELYTQEYEIPYIALVRDYYARESAAFIAQNGVSLYMCKAEIRLEEEAVRAKKYLDPSSFDRLRKECDLVLVERHKDLLHGECEAYLLNEKLDDLARMYRLAMRLGEEGTRAMLDTLQKYVYQSGIAALRAVSIPDLDKDPAPYVESLLATYTQYSDVVRRAFGNDAAFVAALDKACRRVVNNNPINGVAAAGGVGSKSAELLAKYCDVLLKKGAKSLDAPELEAKLTDLIVVFKYLDSRDVFQKFYSKLLARRLIHATSVSDDAESHVISGLKQACGFEYTAKLQRMFTDMALSGDIHEKFQEFLNSRGATLPGKMDFSIQVLTAGSWPLQTTQTAFAVPHELERCIEHFQAYYNTHHHGRRLHWLHTLSKGEVRTGYLKKPYELQVSSFQMAVLLLYNTMPAANISFDDFSRATTLNQPDLQRTLEGLVEAKVVKKLPADDKYTPESQFSLNSAYANKRLKVKIGGGSTKEAKTQDQETYKGIEDDRKLYLQAAIVRIMKARKLLQHTALVNEVIEQSRQRFQPNVPMIKKCIEYLIDKEYLKRQEGTSDTYAYLA